MSEEGAEDGWEVAMSASSMELRRAGVLTSASSEEDWGRLLNVHADDYVAVKADKRERRSESRWELVKVNRKWGCGGVERAVLGKGRRVV